MTKVQTDLSKSLDALEGQAEELLKSQAAPAGDEIKKGEEVKPGEVAEENNEAPESGDKAPAKKEEAPKKEEDTKKSFREELEDNETISKSIDASDFLSEFANVSAGAIDGLRAELSKSLEGNARVNDVLAKGLQAVLTSQSTLVNTINQQAELIKSLQGRVDEVEKQPVPRKAAVTVIEKGFNHSAGLGQEQPQGGQPQELSKGEKLAKMSNMLMKGVQGITVNDVVKYESTGQMSLQVKDLLENN